MAASSVTSFVGFSREWVTGKCQCAPKVFLCTQSLSCVLPRPARLRASTPEPPNSAINERAKRTDKSRPRCQLQRILVDLIHLAVRPCFDPRPITVAFSLSVSAPMRLGDVADRHRLRLNLPAL